MYLSLKAYDSKKNIVFIIKSQVLAQNNKVTLYLAVLNPDGYF